MLEPPKGLNTLMVTNLSIKQWTISRKPNYKLKIIRSRILRDYTLDTSFKSGEDIVQTILKGIEKIATYIIFN